MPEPVWWPEVMAAAGRRRHVTGLLLKQATPSVRGGVLRLDFTNPDIARTWEESGAQAALEGALQASGRAIPVQAVSS